MAKGEEGARRALTYDDRLIIEQGLNRGDTISRIARALGRTPATVAEEVKRNWTDRPKGMLYIENRNICAKKGSCEVTRLCKGFCVRGCWRCKDWLCNSLCDDFQAVPCPRLAHAPYCCNACGMRVGFGCDHQYRFYEAKYADDLAKRRRSTSRAGIDMTPEGFAESIEAVKAGLALGQSPAHICRTDERVGFSKSTFYRLLDGASAGDITKLDLPRAVRYRPRRPSKPQASQVPRAYIKGRSYEDFQRLEAGIAENCVEMDTVMGRRGADEQCVLTLYFRRLRVQLFLLLEHHTSDDVVAALDDLECR